ncbi:hypothetical protein MFLAVUS_004822 [Mucor flavus]|uniref:F-box domain-containing protein n=1 Tax=Mucor flavus TaxID=439312 RepID=A0ABP9YX10_9FUNG
MLNYSQQSWSDLPEELLQCVFQQVHDNKTIFQCQLVCKSWKWPAKRIVYQTINISSYGTQIKKLFGTLQSLKHLGERVNTINFNVTVRNLENPWDQKGYFEKLAAYCPNVKVITSQKP